MRRIVSTTVHAPTRSSNPRPLINWLRRLEEPARDRDRVADGHRRERVLPVLRADVNPVFLDLQRLAALVRLHQVDGLLADDAVHAAAGVVDLDALPGQDGRVNAADGRKEKIALLVNVRDHQPDLVAMAGEHHAQRRVRVLDGDHVAVHVGAHLVRRVLEAVADQLLGGLLETGRAGRLDQLLQKLQRRAFHGAPPLKYEVVLILAFYRPRARESKRLIGDPGAFLRPYRGGAPP